MSVVHCDSHGDIDTDFDAEHFKYGTEECGIYMTDLDVIIDEIGQLGWAANGKQQIKDLMLELIDSVDLWKDGAELELSQKVEAL